MIIIGSDYHPAFQQIAFVDTETGELQERRLQHREEAEKFYRELATQGARVRVGMEASGHARWFEGLMSDLGFELWIGDAAEIRTNGYGSRRRIARMHNCCCSCYWRIAFHRFGYPVERIEICGNCCGTGTGWCRRAPGS
jgi:hypothetical protein